MDIPVTSGNVSTRTFSDAFQSWGPFDATNGLRLVVQSAVVEHGLTRHA
jgi:hypothetical protein